MLQDRITANLRNERGLIYLLYRTAIYVTGLVFFVLFAELYRRANQRGPLQLRLFLLDLLHFRILIVETDSLAVLQVGLVLF